MKGKRDSCGHEDSLRALLDAVRGAASNRARRKRTFGKYADNLSFFLSPALLMKIWTILLGRSFHVTPFLRISFISLRGILRKCLSENVVRKFGRFPMNIGRSINFKTSERRDRSVCRRVTSSLTFGTLDSGDVIITELNPKRWDCHVQSLIVDLPLLPLCLKFRISWTSSINVLCDRKVSLSAATYFALFSFFFTREYNLNITC